MAGIRSSFLGCARIALASLQYNSIRQPDIDNIERLCKIFSHTGCQRGDPENFVTALVDRYVLEHVLIAQNISSTELTYEAPPVLHFPPDVKLECLHGANRLEAARQHLQGDDRWWVVQLYDTSIDATSRAVLQERPNFALPYSNGEKFRSYRAYMGRSDVESAQRWLLQLPKSMTDDISLLERKHDSIIKAFDKLLPMCGLFEEFEIGALNRILGMCCSEELTAYLGRVHSLWTGILYDMVSPSMLDPVTISKLGLLCPRDCIEDTRAVKQLFQKNLVFRQVADPLIRAHLLKRTLECSRIVTICSMVGDTNYLWASQLSLRTIFPKSRIHKQSFRSELREHFKYDGRYFMVNYVELWLFAMRHFPELSSISPLKGRSRPKAAVTAQITQSRVEQLAFTAFALGFRTSEISEQIRSCTQVPEIEQPSNVQPEVSCDWVDLPRRARSNRPTWASMERDSKHIFLERILDMSPSAKKQYVTSFRIIQDTVLSFWPEPLHEHMSDPKRKLYQDAISLVPANKYDADTSGASWLCQLLADESGSAREEASTTALDEARRDIATKAEELQALKQALRNQQNTIKDLRQEKEEWANQRPAISHNAGVSLHDVRVRMAQTERFSTLLDEKQKAIDELQAKLIASQHDIDDQRAEVINLDKTCDEQSRKLSELESLREDQALLLDQKQMQLEALQKENMWLQGHGETTGDNSMTEQSPDPAGDRREIVQRHRTLFSPGEPPNKRSREDSYEHPQRNSFTNFTQMLEDVHELHKGADDVLVLSGTQLPQLQSRFYTSTKRCMFVWHWSKSRDERSFLGEIQRLLNSGKFNLGVVKPRSDITPAATSAEIKHCTADDAWSKLADEEFEFGILLEKAASSLYDLDDDFEALMAGRARHGDEEIERVDHDMREVESSRRRLNVVDAGMKQPTLMRTLLKRRKKQSNRKHSVVRGRVQKHSASKRTSNTTVVKWTQKRASHADIATMVRKRRATLFPSYAQLTGQRQSVG